MENLTGGTPPVRYLPCVVPCKLYFGAEKIPQKYVDTLELRDVILEIADDLYNDCKMTEYGDYYDPVWVAKYIEMTYPKV